MSHIPIIARRIAITVAASLTSAALVYASTDTPTVFFLTFTSTAIFAFFAGMEASNG